MATRAVNRRKPSGSGREELAEQIRALGELQETAGTSPLNFSGHPNRPRDVTSE
jgi:hypothetical protein